MSLVPPLAEASGGDSGEATVEIISSTVLRSAQMFFAKWFGLQIIRIGNLPRVQTKVDALIMIAELSTAPARMGFAVLVLMGCSGQVNGYQAMYAVVFQVELR